MKIKNTLLLLIIISIATVSCQKNETEIEPLPEPGYPTVYERLPTAEWESLNAEFQNMNSYDGLELSKFGFLMGEFSMNENDLVDTEFVIETVDNLLRSYSKFLGIPVSDYPDWKNELYGSSKKLDNIISERVDVKEYFKREASRANPVHSFYLEQEHINGQRVSQNGGKLGFIFNEKTRKIQVEGQWFPDAILPKKLNFPLEDALDVAANYFSDHLPEHYWNVNSSAITSERVFSIRPYPEKNIVCDCWRITLFRELTTTLYVIEIDTQTGNIIGEPYAW